MRTTNGMTRFENGDVTEFVRAEPVLSEKTAPIAKNVKMLI